MVLWKNNVGHTRMQNIQTGALQLPPAKAKGPFARLERQQYADALDALTLMDRMAARAPAFKGRMFRGLGVSTKLGKQLATEGAVMELESWTSFTTSRKLATTFGPAGGKGGGVFIRYSVKVKDTPVFDARGPLRTQRVGIASNVREDENEVIAPRGARFRTKKATPVRAVKTGDKIIGYNIELEEINGG